MCSAPGAATAGRSSGRPSTSSPPREGSSSTSARRAGGIGLYNKLDAYILQDGGLDTFEANRKLNFADDLRDYRPAAQMLAALSVTAVKLLTNNPDKARQLTDCGMEVRSTRTTGASVSGSNRGYLTAKREVAGHRIELPDAEPT
ncbi:GTP cyclohydrolase-2 [Streptomyces microflavus]